MKPVSVDIPPAGVQVIHAAEGPTILIKWFHYSHIPTIILAISWNGFATYWYFKYVAPNTIFRPILLIPILIGFSLAYFALAKTINDTCISISRGTLIVSSQPLPWPGNIKLSKSYAKEIGTSYDVSVSNPAFQSSSVYILDQAGKKHWIIRNLEATNQAYYIQKVIKEHLGIKN